jgi:hypothetical protein
MDLLLGYSSCVLMLLSTKFRFEVMPVLYMHGAYIWGEMGYWSTIVLGII